MKPYYDEGGVTIYHGDCREIASRLAFDVVVTDPPYGVNFGGKNTKWTTRRGSGYASHTDSAEYVEQTIVPFVETLISRTPVVMTPGSRMMFRYPEPTAVGTIFYPAGAGMGRWGFTCSQPIFYYGKDPYLANRLGSRPNSFKSTERAEDNGHPCPKPIGTMRWLVNRASLPDQTILDPFMGSGTTLVAAKELGRKAIGIETDECYCEIAANRLAQLDLEVAA